MSFNVQCSCWFLLQDTEVNDSKYKDGIVDLEAREQILLEVVYLSYLVGFLSKFTEFGDFESLEIFGVT